MKNLGMFSNVGYKLSKSQILSFHLREIIIILPTLMKPIK